MSEWISVEERLPDAQKKVIAFYLNSHGKARRIMAEYIPAHTVKCCDYYSWDCDFDGEYFDGDDEEYVKESWHELIENWHDFSSCEVCEGKITHWMPLPDPPQ